MYSTFEWLTHYSTDNADYNNYSTQSMHIGFSATCMAIIHTISMACHQFSIYTTTSNNVQTIYIHFAYGTMISHDCHHKLQRKHNWNLENDFKVAPCKIWKCYFLHSRYTIILAKSLQHTTLCNGFWWFEKSYGVYRRKYSWAWDMNLVNKKWTWYFCMETFCNTGHYTGPLNTDCGNVNWNGSQHSVVVEFWHCSLHCIRPSCINLSYSDMP